MANKLINCKTCGREMSSDAKVCPGCGAKNKKPFYVQWWFVLIAVIIVLAIIGSCQGDDETDSTTTTTGTKKSITTSEADPTTVAVTTAEPTTVASTTEAIESTVDLSSIEKEYTLTSGHYTAGIDLPSGKCDVVAVSGTGNLSSSNMFSGGINEMFGKGDDMFTSEFNGLKLPEDVVLTVSGGLKIKLIYTTIDANYTGRTYDEAEKITLKSGNYVAGEDFPDGTYKIVAVKGTGNISSSNMFDQGINEMFGVGDSMFVDEFLNVLLEDKTTLELSGGVTVELIPSN